MMILSPLSLSQKKRMIRRWWFLWTFLFLSVCLALPLVPPPTYRLYNSTLLELNTTVPLDLDTIVVELSCNGNSSMNLTLAEQAGNTTLFSVQGCLVPLGVLAFTSDGDLWTVLASSDPGPACFPPPTCEEYVFGDLSVSAVKPQVTEIPTVNKTFWDLDPIQQAAVILLSALGGLVLGLVIALLWRACCFKIHQHRNRFTKL